MIRIAGDFLRVERRRRDKRRNGFRIAFNHEIRVVHGPPEFGLDDQATGIRAHPLKTRHQQTMRFNMP